MRCLAQNILDPGYLFTAIRSPSVLYVVEPQYKFVKTMNKRKQNHQEHNDVSRVPGTVQDPKVPTVGTITMPIIQTRELRFGVNKHTVTQLTTWQSGDLHPDPCLPELWPPCPPAARVRSSVPGEDGSGDSGWPRGVGTGAGQGRRLGREEGEAAKRQVGSPEVDRRQAEGLDIRAYSCLYRNRLSQSPVGTQPSFVSQKMKWICHFCIPSVRHRWALLLHPSNRWLLST